MADESKPEQIELNKKKAELSKLEARLAQSELALATLTGSLRSFQARYMKIVGLLIAELDDIEAQIAEAEMGKDSTNTRLKDKASEARAKARESAEGIDDIVKESEEPFKPTKNIKDLYRKVAKLIHPDLSNSEDHRNRREQLMTEANLAYQTGDENRLREIMYEWESSPETVEGQGVAAELVRTIRKLAQGEARIKAIELEMLILETSEWHQLKLEAEKEQLRGRDLLNEMASQVREQIANAKSRLTN